MTYHALNTLLGQRLRRKLSHNTWAVRLGYDTIAVQYHATEILRFYSDGRVTFYTGGWRTVTTKQRLNKFGPSHIHIHQRNFDWYITDLETRSVTPFYDGITLQCPTHTILQ